MEGKAVKKVFVLLLAVGVLLGQVISVSAYNRPASIPSGSEASDWSSAGKLYIKSVGDITENILTVSLGATSQSSVSYLTAGLSYDNAKLTLIGANDTVEHPGTSTAANVDKNAVLSPQSGLTSVGDPRIWKGTARSGLYINLMLLDGTTAATDTEAVRLRFKVTGTLDRESLRFLDNTKDTAVKTAFADSALTDTSALMTIKKDGKENAGWYFEKIAEEIPAGFFGAETEAYLVQASYTYPGSETQQVDTVTVSGGQTDILVPASDGPAASTAFTAEVKDIHGYDYEGAVVWSLVDAPEGVSIDSEGVVSVTAAAKSTITDTTGIAYTVKATAGGVSNDDNTKITVKRDAQQPTAVKIYRDGMERTGADTLVIPRWGSEDYIYDYDAKLFDQYGSEIADRTPEWSDEDTVVPEGVTHANGTVTVTDNAPDNHTFTLTAAVEDINTQITIKVNNILVVWAGIAVKESGIVYGDSKLSMFKVAPPTTGTAIAGVTFLGGDFAIEDPNARLAAGARAVVVTFTVTTPEEYKGTVVTRAYPVNVAPKAITVTPDPDQGKVFGDPDPALTYIVSPALEAGDAFTGALQRASGEDAGEYEISNNDLSAGENYALTVTGGAKFTIRPKPLQADWIDITETLTYTGAAQTPAYTVKYKNGNEIILAEGTDFTAAPGNNTNAGTDAATLALAGKGNYGGTARKTFSIAKAPLTIASATVAPKTYDGTASAEIGGVTFEGLQNNETLALGTDYTVSGASFNDADVADAHTVTAAAALKASAKANNYSLANGAISQAATISKATIEGVDRTYYVEAGKALTYSFNLSKLLPSVAAPKTLGAVSYAPRPETDENDILGSITTSPGAILRLPTNASSTGGAIAMIPVEITAGNYIITPNPVITAEAVNGVPVSISANVSDKIYDGTAFAFTLGAITKNIDDSPVTGLTPVCEYAGAGGTAYPASEIAPSAVGSYKLTVTVNETLGEGPDAVKYIGKAVYAFNISKKTPTKDDLSYDLTAKTYNKTAQGIAVTAKSGTDGLGTITVKYDGDTSAPTNADTRAVTVEIAEGANFAAANLELGGYTINKKPITLTADDKEMTRGGSLPAFTYTVSGLESGDELTAEPALTTSADGATAGDHTIVISGGDAGVNYIITRVNGTLKVNAADDDDPALPPSGGSGGGSGGGTTSTPTVITDTVSKTSTVTINSVTVVSNGIAAATISDSVIADGIKAVIKEAQANNTDAVLTIKADPKTAEALSAVLTIGVCGQLADGKVTLKIDAGGLGTTAFNPVALKTIAASDSDKASKVTLRIGKVNIADLTEAQRAALNADDTIVDFTVESGGGIISDFKGGTVAVSLPYKLPGGAKAAEVVTYHLDGDGGLELAAGRYRATTGSVDLLLRHLSKYVIRVNAADYTVTGGWYDKDSMDFAVARNLLDNYVVDGKINAAQGVTRGDFIAAIMKVMAVSPSASFKTAQFKDADPSDPNAPYIHTAKELGVVHGDNAEMTVFAPYRVATRGEQFQIMYNLIKAGLSNAPANDTGRDLSFAADADAVAPWLKPAVTELLKLGVIEGDDNRRLQPDKDFTAGETAAVLEKLTR
jgi:hypothetical protein